MKKNIMSGLILLFVVACGNPGLDLGKGTIEDLTYKETEEITTQIKIETTLNEVILLELYPELAPITAANFQNLVQRKFYDGSLFHRIVLGFMIQGGQSATGEIADEIKGEFKNNGVENPITHARGVLSMARFGDDKDSASSQFFIVHEDSWHLDGEYAAFGRVVAGMDAVDRIANVGIRLDQLTLQPKPIVDQVIRSIRFVTIEAE